MTTYESIVHHAFGIVFLNAMLCDVRWISQYIIHYTDSLHCTTNM